MTEFERSLERIADRALARRRIARDLPPITVVRVHNRDRGYWDRLRVVATTWMRIEEIAVKSGLTITQVQGQIRHKRDRLRMRGSKRNGCEWRVK